MYFPGMEDLLDDDGGGAENINLVNRDAEYPYETCYRHTFPDTGTNTSWCKYCGKEGKFDWRAGKYLTEEERVRDR